MSEAYCECRNRKMNSLYGASANRYFIYYRSEYAEGITMSGQLSIRYAEMTVNNYLNKVLDTHGVDYITYCDTDSIYVNLEPLVAKMFGTADITREQGEEFLDQVCKAKIEGVITRGYEDLAKRMGAFRNAMSMKREKINNKAVFVAKKRYILNTLNSEGVHYQEPKISVTGLEVVRSSTPEICRKKMKDAFKVIMNGTEAEAQDFIEAFREEFFKLPPEAIAKNSGTEDIEKYMERNGLYRKGTPAHVRGCIMFNHRLKELDLHRRYETIRSGDKVKFCYLKLPNPLRENIVSFPQVLPKELGLHKYVDYGLQFEKVFLDPLTAIFESIGWRAERIDTLEAFFS